MLVIADDFTGANDTGVMFTKNNAVVDIVLDWQHLIAKEADVVVVNTDSRAVSADIAAERIETVLQFYSNEKSVIYKKVDSTLRGNVGAELEALLQQSTQKAIFFCTALPTAKRSVRNGICYVAEQPLLDTEFATDPKTPILSSNVREIIEKQTALPIIEIHLATLRADSLLSEINHILTQQEKCILCFDAEKEQDLAIIAQLSHSFAEVIFAGSSGLAAHFAQQCKNTRSWPQLSENIKTQSQKPMLFIVASMSEMTNCQVEQVSQKQNMQIIHINVEQFFLEGADSSFIIQQILTALNNQYHVIVKTISDAKARSNVEQLCSTYQLTRQQLGEYICLQLSLITSVVLQQMKNNISALFLTGGDIAIGVAKQLGIQRYRICDEIESGVPVGYFVQNTLSDLPVITKAGGFGSINVLQKVIDFIRN